MNLAALKPMPGTLRVAVFAAEPERLALLMGLVRGFGHIVTDTVADASVVLTDGVPVHGSRRVVAIDAGREEFQGRLPRRAAPEQLDAALRAVAVGLSVFIAEEPRRNFEALHEDNDRVLLTPREIEVLNAVSNGSTNKEIARDLGISRHTVKFHLVSLMRKLGASSRTEAVSKSLRMKLLEPYSL